uniref:DNA-directed RNA polymerase n=1 Tax=Jenufa minuta TaxID=993092 RepID=A0A0S2LNS2_JENMI|nr:beta subunit of RNA polymerase [Jenufa minuta]ALO62979.1 beta subunit of RNA polymerase [Jenufa minuta]
MKRYSPNIHDFITVQRKSFQYFLEKGIIKEFLKINPITNQNKNVEIMFYPTYYKMLSPECSIRECLLKMKSYTAKLYMPMKLTNQKTGKFYIKWLYVMTLPLMTKRGHFILNGGARVIVNQVLRSPGIYFHEKIHDIYTQKDQEKPDSSFSRYYADFICLKGTWLRLEIDKDKLFWAQMKKRGKLPLFWFLLATGLNEKTILTCIPESYKLVQNLAKYHPGNVHWLKTLKKLINQRQLKNSTSNEIWKILYSFMLSTINNEVGSSSGHPGEQWLYNKFFNPQTYDLGRSGRLSINKKLGLSLNRDQTTLTPQDLLFATNSLIKVEKGLKSTDDIDHLKNRRVRTSGELLQTQLSIGLFRLAQSISEKLNTLEIEQINMSFMNNLQNIMNVKAVNGAFKEFFGSCQLSQFMDQMNPLAEITHKRRLTSLGPGGITRDTSTLAIRGIHPTHYGRICPIETPEGKNTGLVNSITTYGRVNPQGLLQTPFFKVYKGQVQKSAGLSFLSASTEEKFRIAPADLKVSSLGFLPKSILPVRIDNKFTKIKRSKIDFLSLSPFQMISIATSLIPFLEHDDANRALMGSNMQRQAVSLIRPQRPIVGTGLEARVISDSGHVAQANRSGVLAYSTSEKIVIYTLQN